MTGKIDRLDERAAIAALDGQRRPLLEAIRAAADVYEEAKAGSEEEVAAEAALDRANEAVEAFDDLHSDVYGEALDYDEDGMARCCVLTGLVLLEDDEIVEDREGRQALAAAIEGWPAFDGAGDSPCGEPAASAGSRAEEGAANDDGFDLGEVPA